MTRRREMIRRGGSPAPNPHAYVPNPCVQIDPLGLVGCEADNGAGGGSPGALERVRNFADKRLAFQHCAKHVRGVKLGSSGGARYVGADMPEYGSFADYTNAARAFMGGGTPAGAIEGVRPGGDLVRLDPQTGQFGISTAAGAIRTYFRPDGGPGDWMEYFRKQFQE